jgi:glycosyltransferase involved in cell wall biosynthesis
MMGVMDETYSLRQTVRTLQSGLTSIQFEIILVVSPLTSNDSIKTINELTRECQNIVIIKEVHPGIGGAYMTAIEASVGRYLVLMSSDLETDPSLVPILLGEKKRLESVDIVCVSRWINKKSFIGYSSIQRMLNSIFQKIVRKVSSVSLTDFTYAFRIYDASIVKGLEFKELSHGFFLESLLTPISRGCRVAEVPGTWVARSEGERHIRARDYLTYVRVLFRFIKEKNSRGDA